MKIVIQFLINIRTAFLAFIICWTITPVFAQNDFSNINWFYGSNSNCLLFNRSDGQVKLDSLQATPFNNGGSAVATSYFTGDILFYSDGENVYDATHGSLTTVNGNGGINQPVSVAPVPGNSSQYYLIYNSGPSAPNRVASRIIDMSLAGNGGLGPPLGDVTGTATTIYNTNPPSEAMIVIPGNSLLNNYLLIQDAVTTEYLVFSIDTSNTFTQVNSLTLNQQFRAANFSYSPAAQKIAISPQDQNRNVHLLDFDPATGAITFDMNISNTGNSDFATEAIYDTEWSLDGTKIYISRHGGNGNIGDVFQVDLQDSTLSVNSILSSTVSRSYGLKIAPDSNIYHLYRNGSGQPFQIGVINNPDSSANQVNYDPSPFGSRNFQGKQFPEFSPPQDIGVFDTLDFVFEDNCINLPTKFYPSVFPQPETFSWDFGDGNMSTDQSPINTYMNAGAITVTLTVDRNGMTDMITKSVNIIDPMVMINIGNDTTICRDETLALPTLSGQAIMGGNIFWSTGETGPTITVDTTNIFWVSVDVGGCVLYDAIMVEEFEVSEQIANFWYFGDNAGLDFSQTPPLALNDGAMIALEGCATVSDANGDLLFYTNGSTVFNQQHQIMLNGTSLGGSASATQSSLIVQFPMDETYYYLFTNQAVYGNNTNELRYSVVDIKRGNGEGEVVLKNKLLFSKSTERMTAIGNMGSNAWLVAHEYGNNNFRAYPITDTGIGTPVISSVGSIHSFNNQEQGQGYMKFNTGGDKIAVALPVGPNNFVEVFDFDITTGEITEFLNKVNVQSSGSVYGLEFSPGGNKLFMSFRNSRISEVRIDTNNVALAEASVVNLPGTNGGDVYGAIQVAPDQQIYVAIENAGFLGSVQPNDSIGQPSQFNPNGLNLAGGTNSRLGLPNFIQNMILPPMAPSMSVSNGCDGDSVTFAGTGASQIDDYIWTVSQGGSFVASSTDQNPSFLLNAGTFQVSLQVSNRCGFDTTFNTQTIEIFNSPTSALPDFETFCATNPAILRADTTGNPSLSFIWSTGETTPTITLSQAGLTTVTITDGNSGCVTTDTVFVFDGNLPINFPADQNICQNDNFPTLDAGNPGGAYTWFLNGTDLQNPTRFQMVNTSTAGTFEYIVEVQDAINPCITRDTVVLVIQPEPGFTANPNATSDCGVSDGSITLTGGGAGNFVFAWSNGATTQNLNGILAGLYSVAISDQITGCTQDINAIGVSDGNAPFAIDPNPPTSSQCLMGVFEGTIDFTITGILSSGTFRILSTIDNSVADQGNLNGPGSFTAMVPTDGTYTLEVFGDGCLLFENNIVVPPAPTVDFSVPLLVNGCTDDGGTLLEVTINNPQDFDYNWSTNDGNFVTTPAPNTPQVAVTATGTYTINVVDRNGVLCDSTASIMVTIGNAVDAQISLVGDDCDGVQTLTAIDGNNPTATAFTYVWSTGENSQNINVDTTGLYRVVLKNQITGCNGTGEDSVSVREAVAVTITSPPQCDNALPLPLTADVGLATNLQFVWTMNGSAVSETTGVLEVNTDGLYTVTITQDICVDNDDIMVSIDSATFGELEPEVEFCSLDPATPTLTLNPGAFALYEWSTGATSRTITVMDGGFFTVSLTNSSGCVTVDTTFVDNDCRPRIIVPNAFAPSSSISNNQVFKAFLDLRVDQFDIFIFNRWGELVFSDNTIDFAWDGRTNNGVDAAMGTYGYVMKFTSALEPELGVIEQRGGVVLVR